MSIFEKILNTALSVIILAVSILAITGYYRCYSQETAHIYGSCCSEKVIEESCCCSSDDLPVKEIGNKCCDKVDIQISDERSSIFAVAKDENLDHSVWHQSLKVLSIPEKLYLFISPSKSPPDKQGQRTYILNCTFLC